MYKHILLPTDGSKLSEKAVKQCIRLAKSLGAKSIDLKGWGSRPFYTGEAPARRAV